MTKTLEGTRALITGSSKGIGRATAIRFAREGARVAVHGRDEGDLEETLRRVREAGGDGVSLTADLGDAETSRRLVERAIEGLGGLDVLVNNAGTQKETPFEEEVAAAIAFLAGEDGRYVHGTTLFVDGGLTWQYQE